MIEVFTEHEPDGSETLDRTCQYAEFNRIVQEVLCRQVGEDHPDLMDQDAEGNWTYPMLEEAGEIVRALIDAGALCWNGEYHDRVLTE